MTGAIGWYVHHHGRGHLTRLLAIAPHLDREVRVFSSLDAPTALPANCSWILLPRDDDTSPGAAPPHTAEPTADGMLHWAPLAHPGHARRLAMIADAVADGSISAFVVDVSVEVALFVRLLGIAPVVIAQPGTRGDLPHRLAYTAARTIVAPWPRDLLEPEHLRGFRDRTVYTGGISRFERRTSSAQRTADGDVVLLSGRGGTAVTDAEITRASSACGIPWRVLGEGPGGGWIDDPFHALRSARVVVSWAGQNAIADLAATQAAAVVLPQTRPFGEQVATARALDRAGLAVVRAQWPPADEWPALIEEAAARRPDWSRWQVAGAAERAAAAIDAAARRS